MSSTTEQAPSATATLQAIKAVCGNVDHTQGNGPRSAEMRGHLLNYIRDMATAAAPDNQAELLDALKAMVDLADDIEDELLDPCDRFRLRHNPTLVAARALIAKTEGE
jgi:hypothetical protein